jgi:predicted dehydrogenase
MNILIVGYGSIAKKHISSIYKYINLPIIYALRSKKNYIEIPNIKSISSIDEIKCRIDFIIISNPTKFHSETIFKLLSHNIPLFIEKPVLNDLIYADKIKKIIFDNSLLTYVACNMRFHPSLIYLKSFLERSKNKINEVNIYCGSYLPNWRPTVDYRKSYSSIKEMGGGVNLDLIHEIDYCVWLFGIPIKTNLFNRKVSNLEINSYDTTQLFLEYANFNTNISLNYFRIDSKREIEILFEEYTLKVDLLKNTITDLTNNTIIYNKMFDIQETYDKQMNYFIDCIALNQIPMNSFSESIDVLKIVLNE